EGGTITGTTEHRNENVTGDGVMQNENGEYVENDVEVPYVTYLREYYARDNIESNSFDATYLKLRELKIGYNIPNNLLERLPIRSASFSLVGRNLLLFTDVPHIDPETTYMSGSEHVPGFEVHQLPSTRSFGFNVNLEL
ncbi:MAG: SusC/RagA family TonB-linked outer membrane protein, partial [Balneolaceae bacterium]